MATMFKINGVDYSDFVVAESYQVQSNDIYKSWIDANEKEHRCVTRTRVSGSFKMFFNNAENYSAFMSALKNCKNNDTSYPITVFDNYENQLVSISAFLSFTTVRSLSDSRTDKFDVMTVNVLEV